MANTFIDDNHLIDRTNAISTEHFDYKDGVFSATWSKLPPETMNSFVVLKTGSYVMVLKSETTGTRVPFVLEILVEKPDTLNFAKIYIAKFKVLSTSSRLSVLSECNLWVNIIIDLPHDIPFFKHIIKDKIYKTY